jgi:hypothetical protein
MGERRYEDLWHRDHLRTGIAMCEEETIRRLVKEIDTRFDCIASIRRGGYTITQKSPLGMVSDFAFIPWDGLTKTFFDNMRRNIWLNRNGNPMRDIVQNNAELEQRHNEKVEENIDYVTKTAAPDLLRAFKDV